MKLGLEFGEDGDLYGRDLRDATRVALPRRDASAQRHAQANTNAARRREREKYPNIQIPRPTAGAVAPPLPIHPSLFRQLLQLPVPRTFTAHHP